MHGQWQKCYGSTFMKYYYYYYPSPTHSICKDMVVDVCVCYPEHLLVHLLVIPSTCIRGRDIVIAPLVRVSVCLSVCLHLIAS